MMKINRFRISAWLYPSMCWLFCACVLIPHTNRIPAETKQPQTSPSPHIFPSPDVFPRPCTQIPETGLPVDPSILDSNLLYQGHNSEANREELWVYSVKTNTHKRLESYGKDNLGLGFLKDGYHFVLARGVEQAWLGDLSDPEPRLIDVDEDLLKRLRPNTELWIVLGISSKNPPPGASEFFRGRFYSPDGKKVAAWVRGDPSLLITDRATGESIPVVKVGPADTIIGGWTSTGDRFVFSHDQSLGEGNYFTQLYVVNSDGHNLRSLTTRYEKASINTVVLSPDDTKVAFILNEPDQGNNSRSIGILDLSTGELRLFIVGIPLDSDSRPGGMSILWSPDSKWLAYFVHWDQIDIRVLNMETGENYCITNSDFIENLMDWR